MNSTPSATWYGRLSPSSKRWGIVVRQPNRGAAVRDFSADEVEQIYNVRGVLERYAAEIIPLPADPVLLGRLREIQARHGRAVDAGDPRTVFRANLEFHRVFFGACGNPYLAEQIDQLASRAHAIRFLAITDDALLDRARREHGQMIAYLGDRRAGEADRAGGRTHQAVQGGLSQAGPALGPVGMSGAVAGERVSLELAGAVATLTLQRPDKRNAIDLDMLAGLEGRLRPDRRRPRHLRRHPCRRRQGPFGRRRHRRLGAHDGRPSSAGTGSAAATGSSTGWRRYGVPLIAVATGAVYGGGLELAACADIRIADAEATFGLPETGLGIIPGWSGTQRLVRRFGGQPVRRMVLGAEILTADEALRLGIVDHVVAPGQALAAAQVYAGRVAGRSPVAANIAKLMIAAGSNDDAGAAIDTLAGVLAARPATDREGVAAFLGKRPAAFKGQW